MEGLRSAGVGCDKNGDSGFFAFGSENLPEKQRNAGERGLKVLGPLSGGPLRGCGEGIN